MLAKNKGHDEVARLLTKQLDATDVLLRAAEDGDTAAIRQLVEDCANVDITAPDGQTALMAAVANDHANAVRLLIETGANVNATDKDGVTALMWAVGGSYDTVRLLIERGAEVNATNKDGETALMWANEEDRADIARLLIEHGAK